MREDVDVTLTNEDGPVYKERSKNCTEPGGNTVLYRDEDNYTHSYVQAYYEPNKGYGKKATEEKERYAGAQRQQDLQAHGGLQGGARPRGRQPGSPA